MNLYMYICVFGCLHTHGSSEVTHNKENKEYKSLSLGVFAQQRRLHTTLYPSQKDPESLE